MLKAALYSGLFAIGLAAGIASPVIAALVNMQVFFVEPQVLIGREISFDRYQLASAVVLIASVVINGARGLTPVGKEGRLLNAMWIYTGIAMATSLWAMSDPATSFDKAFQFSKTVLAATLFTLVVQSERDFHVLVRACLVGVAHLAFITTWGRDKLDWVSKYAHPCTDREGSVILLFLPLVILLGIYGDKLERLFCWLSLPFILDTIIRSNHRAYFLGLLVQMGLLLFFLPKRIVKRISPILIVGACLFVFVLTPDKYWVWMSTIKNPTQEGSANSRFVIWRASVRVLLNHPMGVGYNCFPQVMGKYTDALGKGGEKEMDKNTHNTFFSVACETGVLGFAAWATAVGGAILAFRKIRKQANYEHPTRIDLYAMAFEFGYYGTLVGDLFHTGYETDPLYWLVGFAVIMTRLRYARPPETEPLSSGGFASREPATVYPLGLVGTVGRPFRADL